MSDIEISRADRRKRQTASSVKGYWRKGSPNSGRGLSIDQRTGAGERRVAIYRATLDQTAYPLSALECEQIILALRRERPAWDVEKAQAELQRQALAAACAWATGQDATFDAEAIFKAGGGER